VIYQDPLGYLLGLEGIALLDAWAEGCAPVTQPPDGPGVTPWF
jgi:hypothetical protein